MHSCWVSPALISLNFAKYVHNITPFLKFPEVIITIYEQIFVICILVSRVSSLYNFSTLGFDVLINGEFCHIAPAKTLVAHLNVYLYLNILVILYTFKNKDESSIGALLKINK